MGRSRYLLAALALATLTTGRADAVQFQFSTTISGDSVPVTLSLEDGADGSSVAVLVSVPAGSGDLLGLFGNVGDESLLAAMTVQDPTGLVTDAEFRANGVTKVGGGNNVNPVKNWDFGLRFGRNGSADGAVESAAFTLSAPGLSVQQLLAATNQGWLFGVRLQSTNGPEGGSKAGLSGQAPRLSISVPQAGSLFNGQPIVVSGTVAGAGVSVTVNGVGATVTGTTFEASVPLAEGPNEILAVATNFFATISDRVQVVLDTIAPRVQLQGPAEGTFVLTSAPSVAATFSDERTGIRPGSARLLVDGIDRTGTAQQDGQSVTWTPAAPLSEGLHAVLVTVEDLAGNQGSVGWSFTVDTVAPALTFRAPAAGRLIARAAPSWEISFSDRTSSPALETFSLTLEGATTITPTCRFEPILARCAATTLPTGAFVARASLMDRAGNRAEATLNLDFFLDQQAPLVQILTPAPGGLTNAPLSRITGLVRDDSGAVASVTVNGLAAVVAGETFAVDLPLNEGTNAFLAVAVDTVGRQATATSTAVLDTQPPELTLRRPTPDQFVNQQAIRVEGSAADNRGLAEVTLNGQPLALTGGSFDASFPLQQGSNTLVVEARDQAGNRRQQQLAVTRFALPEVQITSPAEGSSIAAASVDVAGAFSEAGAAVTVNGVTAEISGLSFLARGVPIIEGGNVLTATINAGAGRVATDSVNVLRDLTPPRLRILRPVPRIPVFQDQVTVAGLVNDIVAGTVNAGQVTVTVNGQPAQVANRSFVATGIPLQLGTNPIEVIARDVSGNEGRIVAEVERLAPNIGHIVAISGDGQTAAVGQDLASPLVIAVFGPTGQPVEGAQVLFKITASDGSLDGGQRQIVRETGFDGRAVAHLRLGGRAGAAAQSVTALAPGFAGRALFSVTATPGAPAHIVVDAGDQQVGVAGRALPRPLVATVTDVYFNRLPGVPVRFSIVQGSGQFVGGGDRLSDSDGRASATLILDPEEGIANTIAEAVITGLPNSPVASFVASSRTAGPAPDTRVSGLVLDNTDQPVPGVTIHIRDTSLTATTDSGGHFSISGAPVGTLLLDVDGSTATRPGTWPHLEFHLTTVPGRDNTLGMPIFLLPLDLSQGVNVDAQTGGVLTLEEVPGFALEIEAGSVTFPNGSKEGLVSVTVVHSDKVPMVPNFGQQPRLIVTIQPAGARFDPPARLTLPNVDALAPGQVTEFYSFDHDLGHFVSIGPGTVSEDGSVVVSDPGVGILKAGWHCGGNPASSGTPHDCPECYKCVNNRCQVDDGGGCDDGDDCTVMDKCEGGSCKGEKREIKMLEALGNGMTSVEEFIDKDISFTSTIDQMHCDSIEYEWDLGDGTMASGASTSHKYEKPGTYNVTLKAKCGDCDSETANVSVTIKCPMVEIDSASPNISEICPGCDIQYTAKTDPTGYTIYWSLPADLGGKASISSSGLLKIDATAGAGSVTVRASALMDGSDCKDERSVQVFAPASPPKPPGGSRTAAENAWIRSHLWCAFKSRNLQSECVGETKRRFGTTTDGTRANSFQHAYCNCLTASRCGDAAASELWDAHEDYGGNPCHHASMDLHNNQVGRRVSTGDESMCGQLVMDAMTNGDLRWMDPPTPGCPTFRNTP